MIALVAVFALLVQALFPALATAAPAGPDGTVLICTSHGLERVPAGDLGDAGGDPGPCNHCVCPASVAAPPPPATAVAVLYAVAAEVPVAPAEMRGPPARAPPRPPGQGPPRLNA